MKRLKPMFSKLDRKKTIILIVVLLIVAGGSAFAANRMFTQKEPKKEELTSYQIEDDSVSAISSVVGERELTEMVKQQEEGIQKVEYHYDSIETSAADVKAYTEYLENQEKFVPLMDSNLDNPAGYVSVARKSVKEGYLFQIDIDYTPKDFNIILSCSQGELPTIYDEESSDDSFTRNDAKTFLDQQPLEKLGLPEPVSSYTTIFDQGRMVIDGKDCYGISVYKKGSGNSNEIVGKYFISLDKSKIYQYSIFDNTYKVIYEEVAPAAPDSLTQEQKAQMAIIQKSFKAAIGQGLNLMLP